MKSISKTKKDTALLQFIFISFKTGGPSANAGLQGALHLLYNIRIKNKTNTYYH